MEEAPTIPQLDQSMHSEPENLNQNNLQHLVQQRTGEFDILQLMREIRKQNDLIDREAEKARERDRLKGLIMPRKSSQNKQKEIPNVNKEIERTQRGFFTLYDDSQFENKQLPQMIEGGEKPFFEKFTEKNRFNSSLLTELQNKKAGKDSKIKVQNGPDPLFGAIQRIQPLQQNKEKSIINGTSLPNPFNIAFEIPPLPSLPSDLATESKDSGGLPTTDFSFFSYLKSKSPLPPKKSPVSRKRSPSGSPSQLLNSSPSSPKYAAALEDHVSIPFSSPLRR